MAEFSSSGNYRDTLTVSGWATSESSDQTWVLLTTGTQHQRLGIVKTDIARPDVLNTLKNTHKLKSGWSGIFDVVNLPRGQYGLEAWVYDESKGTATLIDKRQVILP